MKALGFVFGSALIFVGCATKTPVKQEEAPASTKPVATKKCTGDQSLPMLGYKEDHVADACDKKFIETVLEQSDNNRTVAARTMLEYGWKALDKNPANAVKRFNQAWLLDRKNYEAYWGFGAWEMKRGNTAKAKEFLSKAVSMAPKPLPNDLKNDWEQVQNK